MSDDPELEAIRQQRLAQMQGGQAGGKNENQKRSEMEEQKRVILHQILTPAARERLSRVRLVKPTRAELVENHLIRSAQTGQLRGSVDENQLKGLLEQVSKQERGTKVTFKRRKFDSDEEEEDDDDDEEEEEDY